MEEKEKINRIKLWILFGVAWLIPQIILICFPEEYHWIKVPILISFGIIIIFTKLMDKWLIK